MFPTRDQFRRWTYPTKFAFVSFFVGLFVTTAFWLFPDEGKQLVGLLAPLDRQAALVGTWRGVTQYVDATGNGAMTVSGYTQLLATGEYDFSGDVEIRSVDGTVMLFKAVAAGTWKPTAGGFVLVASDVKSQPMVLKRRGMPDIDIGNAHSDPLQVRLPRLEQFMPRGASQQYKVIEITPVRLRARSNDIRGNPVGYEAIRTGA